MGRKKIQINRERIGCIIEFIRRKKGLSQNDVIDIINTEKICIMQQPALSAIETYNYRASIRNIESVAHALGIDKKILFDERGTFEAIKSSGLQINVPDETLKLYCYIIDAYFSVLPDTVISRIKKAMGAKYPNAVVEMLKRIEKKEVEHIFSYYEDMFFVFSGNETEAEKIISCAVASNLDHFRYLLLKNEIPFFDFYNSLNEISNAISNLKRCYLKDYQRELKRLKGVVDSILIRM
jgi:transcriptional regulator with XRE-family HTH domain